MFKQLSTSLIATIIVAIICSIGGGIYYSFFYSPSSKEIIQDIYQKQGRFVQAQNYSFDLMLYMKDAILSGKTKFGYNKSWLEEKKDIDSVQIMYSERKYRVNLSNAFGPGAYFEIVIDVTDDEDHSYCVTNVRIPQQEEFCKVFKEEQ